jgi:hypothetical protein
VADSAVTDGDLHLLQAQFAWVVLEREKFGSCRVCRKS